MTPPWYRATRGMIIGLILMLLSAAIAATGLLDTEALFAPIKMAGFDAVQSLRKPERPKEVPPDLVVVSFDNEYLQKWPDARAHIPVGQISDAIRYATSRNARTIVVDIDLSDRDADTEDIRKAVEEAGARQVPTRVIFPVPLSLRFSGK